MDKFKSHIKVCVNGSWINLILLLFLFVFKKENKNENILIVIFCCLKFNKMAAVWTLCIVVNYTWCIKQGVIYLVIIWLII